MALHYDGRALVVEFAGTDISAYARSIEFSESAGAPDSLDTTHKDDTEKTHIEGLPNAQSTSAAFTMVDIYDSLTAFGTCALNTKSTLQAWPKGKVHGTPELTLYNARLHERTTPYEYQTITVLAGTFEAKNSLTRGTYTSVT